MINLKDDVTSLYWPFQATVSGKAMNFFERGGRYVDGRWVRSIETVGDLIEMSKGELLRVPGIGRRTADYIERVLTSHGLAFATPPAFADTPAPPAIPWFVFCL